MPLVTPALVQKISKIIQAHHAAFTAAAFGPDAVAPEVLADLQKQGLLQPGAASTDLAFQYGQMLAMNPAAATWSGQQVQDWLQKNPTPLTFQEREAAKTARLTAATYVRGLGNKIDQATGQLLIEADQTLRAKLQEKIRDATAQNILARETTQQLKTALGHATGDWTRNLDRIAITEKHNAMESGQAAAILKNHGTEALVAIQAQPDCCPTCSALTKDEDGHPKIFPLKDLPPPGANVGKKQKDWVLCAGAIHPACNCRMRPVPKGWAFNEKHVLVPAGMLKKAETHPLHGSNTRVTFQGIPITIENPAGSVREWRDRNGNTGQTTMAFAYGEIRGTEGLDGDAIDVYLGPDPTADNAYVIHQTKKAAGFKGLDEQKVMLGFSTAEAAKRAYLMHYDDPRFFGGMDAIPMTTFRQQVRQRMGKKLVGEAVPDHKFVLAKSAFGIPVDAPADRSVSSGGGVNVAAGSPPRPLGGINDTAAIREWLLSASGETPKIYRDKRVYEFSEPVPRRGGFVPDAVAHGVQAHALDNELEPDAAKQAVKTKAAQITAGPVRNVLPPDWEPLGAELEKALTHKYTHKVFSGDHWVYFYAQDHQGKIEPHTSDPDQLALKVHPKHKDKLHALKQQHGLQGPVLQGAKYAILPMTTAEADKIHAAMTPAGTPAKPVPAPAPPAAPSTWSAAQADATLSGVMAKTGLTKEQLKTALTGPAFSGPAREHRVRAIHALLEHGLAHPNAFSTYMSGAHDQAAAEAHVHSLAKGSEADRQRAAKELGGVPKFDTQFLASISMAGKKVFGQATANPGTMGIEMGHGPSGDYVTGDFRHELGHIVHFAWRQNQAINAVLINTHAAAVNKQKSLQLNKAMPADQIEKTLGVIGLRALDTVEEHAAEHYRGLQRALYQEKHGPPFKGSKSVAEYREWHPEVSKLWDAHYTAALLGHHLEKGG